MKIELNTSSFTQVILRTWVSWLSIANVLRPIARVSWPLSKRTKLSVSLAHSTTVYQTLFAERILLRRWTAVSWMRSYPVLVGIVVSFRIQFGWQLWEHHDVSNAWYRIWFRPLSLWLDLRIRWTRRVCTLDWEILWRRQIPVQHNRYIILFAVQWWSGFESETILL